MKESNNEIKKKIESILFAAGKKIEIIEIAKLCRLSHNLNLVEGILNELKKKYQDDDSSLMLMQEGTAWKLTVREKYASVVQTIVTQSELSKSIMETLAVIAYKTPILQSEIIKIRTNKAYGHLKDLESSGYITRRKKGRTKLIELTPKFFEYFDVPPEKLKERFKSVEEIEKAVELKESEAKDANKEYSEKKKIRKLEKDNITSENAKEMKNLDSKILAKEDKIPEIDLVDEQGNEEKLNVYDSQVIEGTDFEEPKSNIEIIKDKVGQLDIVDIGLTPGEKRELVTEAEKLKSEDLSAVGEKEAESAAEKEEEERESEFEKKFDIIGTKKETEAKGPEENVAESAVEEQPAEGEEEPYEEQSAEETAESVEKEKEEKKPEDMLKPSSVKPEEPSDRITTHGIASEAAQHRATHKMEVKEGKRLFEKGIPDNVQKKIDSRVEEIVFGKKPEEESEKKEEEKSGKEETPESY